MKIQLLRFLATTCCIALAACAAEEPKGLEPVATSALIPDATFRVGNDGVLALVDFRYVIGKDASGVFQTANYLLRPGETAEVAVAGKAQPVAWYSDNYAKVRFPPLSAPGEGIFRLKRADGSAFESKVQLVAPAKFTVPAPGSSAKPTDKLLFKWTESAADIDDELSISCSNESLDLSPSDAASKSLTLPAKKGAGQAEFDLAQVKGIADCGKLRATLWHSRKGTLPGQIGPDAKQLAEVSSRAANSVEKCDNHTCTQGYVNVDVTVVP